MNFFKRKYDQIKDRLRLEFDLNTQKYVFYKINEKISDDSLNRKTKRYLDSRNQELIINPQLLKEKISSVKDKQRFKKLQNLGYSCDSFEYLGLVNGTMSNELKQYLTRLIQEENVLLGIHRVKPEITSDQIINILTDGLIITGHLEGVTTSKKALKQNVSYYPNNKTIIKELMYANEFKNAIGSILIRIPDADLAGNIFIIDEKGLTRLNPKYILGFIPVDKNHHIEKIIRFEKSPKTDTNYNTSYMNNSVILESEISDEINKIRK